MGSGLREKSFGFVPRRSSTHRSVAVSNHGLEQRARRCGTQDQTGTMRWIWSRHQVSYDEIDHMSTLQDTSSLRGVRKVGCAAGTYGEVFRSHGKGVLPRGSRSPLLAFFYPPISHSMVLKTLFHEWCDGRGGKQAFCEDGGNIHGAPQRLPNNVDGETPRFALAPRCDQSPSGTETPHRRTSRQRNSSAEDLTDRILMEAGRPASGIANDKQDADESRTPQGIRAQRAPAVDSLTPMYLVGY